MKVKPENDGEDSDATTVKLGDHLQKSPPPAAPVLIPATASRGWGPLWGLG